MHVHIRIYCTHNFLLKFTSKLYVYMYIDIDILLDYNDILTVIFSWDIIYGLNYVHYKIILLNLSNFIKV